MNTLRQLRILNTRPKNQAGPLSQQIMDAGGVSVECPTLEIVGLDNWLPLLPDLNTVDTIIFISPNAVIQCFSVLNHRNIPWPEHLIVIAIGQGTAKALAKFKVDVSEVPTIPDSEHVLALGSLQQIKNQTVLLFKGEGGRVLIEQVLLLKGAKVITLPVYKRSVPAFNSEFINSLWREDLVDIILITSEQSIQNLFIMFNEENHQWIQNKPCLVISERLAKAAALFGIKQTIISHPDTMITTLLDFSKGLNHGQ